MTTNTQEENRMVKYKTLTVIIFAVSLGAIIGNCCDIPMLSGWFNDKTLLSVSTAIGFMILAIQIYAMLIGKSHAPVLFTVSFASSVVFFAITAILAIIGLQSALGIGYLAYEKYLPALPTMAGMIICAIIGFAYMIDEEYDKTRSTFTKIAVFVLLGIVVAGLLDILSDYTFLKHYYRDYNTGMSLPSIFNFIVMCSIYLRIARITPEKSKTSDELHKDGQPPPNEWESILNRLVKSLD